MGRASIKINLGVSHTSENLEGPDSEDKRLERRWKRREHNCCASATKITVKSRGNKAVVTDNNGHMSEDEEDEDYKMFLGTYVSDIDVDRDNNVDGSDIDVNTGYNSDNDEDSDPQYKTFLENLREEGKFYVSSVIVGNQLVHIRYEDDDDDDDDEKEEEEEMLHDEPKSDTRKMSRRDETGNLETAGSDSIREQTGGPVESQQSLETERGPCNKRQRSDLFSVPENNCNTELEVDEDYQIFLNSCSIDGDSLVYMGTGNLGTTGSDSIREQTGSPVESQQSLETERGPFNKRPHLEVSSVPKNNCNTELEFDEDYQIFLNSCRIDGDSLVYVRRELKGKSSSVRQNSQISDQAIDTPVVLCDTDQDYQLFLNSARIVDGNLVYMHDRNITKTYNVEVGSNSCDSDLILLEPNQICENTPFIPSKMYDSSWFEDETNPRDSRQFPACDHSQFRKRLMEYLERPYDQEECGAYLDEVHRQRHKDRHFETRQGVVKSYPAYGVNKSYLELYPDLAKAIAEFKEPHRVLFLLRGFIFWLQNLTHDIGIFRPWLDETCLQILRKM